MFKLSRSNYPIIFAFMVFSLGGIINDFLNMPYREIILYLAALAIPLFIIGLYLSVKNKEFLDPKTDERSKKVDHIAASYSWLITIPFLFVFGIIGEILEYSPIQVISYVGFEMLLTMLLFHVYFNLRGKF